MKKILLIGKFDEMTQNLNTHLSQDYSIQLCADSLELIQGMMKIVKPDLIFIYLKEAESANAAILDYFCKSGNVQTPFLILGGQDELNQYATYEQKPFSSFLKMPASFDFIRVTCDRLINQTDISPEIQRTISEPVSEQKSILIVDDSALLLRNVRAMLTGLYTVYVATSGEQALKVLKKNPIDLVILDYEMPVWDGKKTLEMIRQDNELQEIPVIFLTGVADKEHIAAVLGLNPAGYFLKPPEREKFLDAIKKILEN